MRRHFARDENRTKVQILLVAETQRRIHRRRKIDDTGPEPGGCCFARRRSRLQEVEYPRTVASQNMGGALQQNPRECTSKTTSPRSPSPPQAKGKAGGKRVCSAATDTVGLKMVVTLTTELLN